MDDTRNYIDALADHLPKPFLEEVKGVPLLLRPHSYTAEDISKFMLTPPRAKGTVRLDDAPSFIAFVGDMMQAKAGSTRIYCDADFLASKATITAVLNDHADDGELGWRDHLAVFTPKASVEWTRWKGGHGKVMSQVEFASFIEDNMRDIASVDGMPTGAQMLEMALNLEATQDARFKSAVRLQSGGVDMVFVNKDDDVTAAKMRLFDRFALGIPPFQFGERYQVTARLRYRVKDGAATFWYELVRPDLVFSDALLAVTNNIHKGTGIEVLFGAP